MLVNSASEMQYQVVQQENRQQNTTQETRGGVDGRYADKVTLSSKTDLEQYGRGLQKDLARIDKARNDPNFALDEAKNWASSTSLKQIFLRQDSNGSVSELYADGSPVKNMQSARYQQYRTEYDVFSVQAKQEQQERMTFVNSALADGMEPFEIYKTIRQDHWNNWPKDANE